MITGTVRIAIADLAVDEHTSGHDVSDEERRRLGYLRLIPDAATLVLDVGRRQPSWQAAQLLWPHADRLHIDVQGDPVAVRAWLETLRSGTLGGLPVGHP